MRTPGFAIGHGLRLHHGLQSRDSRGQILTLKLDHLTEPGHLVIEIGSGVPFPSLKNGRPFVVTGYQLSRRGTFKR